MVLGSKSREHAVAQSASYSTLARLGAFDRLEVFSKLVEDKYAGRGTPWPSISASDTESLNRRRRDWEVFRALAPVWLKNGVLED